MAKDRANVKTSSISSDSAARFSSADSLIISAVEQRARTPLTEVAKLLGMRPHIVRYRLQSLIRRGIISGPVPLIDLPALGYHEAVIYFSLSSEKQKLRDQLLRNLTSREGIIWLAGLGGNFQYGLHLCGKSPRFGAALLHELSAMFNNPFHDKSIGTLLRFHSFGHNFLGPKHSSPLTITGNNSPVAADALDLRILAALAAPEAGSMREVSRRCGVPFSTFERRVAELERKKVIAGYMYRIQSPALGLQRFKLQIAARGVSTELSEELLAFCTQHPYIVNLLEFFGTWDYEVGIDVPSPSELFEITRQLYDKFGGRINSIVTVPILSTIRYSSFPLR